MPSITEMLGNWIATGAQSAGVQANMFIASQATGALLLIIAVLSQQFKSMKPILVSQCVTNTLSALSMAFVGGLSGASICFAAIIHTLYIYFHRSKDKEPPLASTIIALIVYLVLAAVSFKRPIDTLTFLTAITYALSIVQNKPSIYRIIILVNSVLWGIYDISIGSYFASLTYVFMIISIIVAMIRHDRKDWKNLFSRK